MDTSGVNRNERNYELRHETDALDMPPNGSINIPISEGIVSERREIVPTIVNQALLNEPVIPATLPLEPSLVDGVSFSICRSGSDPEEHITVDAVHPFFTGYRSIKIDKSTWTDNQRFHCDECDVFFDLTQEAINGHFSTKQHRCIENCLYCHCAVYEYFYNEHRYYYHRCNEQPVNNRNVDSATLIDHDEVSSSIVSDLSTENTSISQ